MNADQNIKDFESFLQMAKQWLDFVRLALQPNFQVFLNTELDEMLSQAVSWTHKLDGMISDRAAWWFVARTINLWWRW